MLMATWQYQEYEARASRSVHLARTSAAPGHLRSLEFQSNILRNDSAFTDAHTHVLLTHRNKKFCIILMWPHTVQQ